MIPTGGILNEQNVESATLPSRTWRIDFDSGRVVGMTDGLDAVKQAVYCILQIDRFRHLIYSPDYGNELRRLIGADPLLVRSEIVRLIREALMEDERITNVDNFQITHKSDSMLVLFRITTDVGSFEQEVEVSV